MQCTPSPTCVILTIISLTKSTGVISTIQSTSGAESVAVMPLIIRRIKSIGFHRTRSRSPAKLPKIQDTEGSKRNCSGSCLVPRRLSLSLRKCACKGRREGAAVPSPWSLAVYHHSLASTLPNTKRLGRRLLRL